MRTDSTSSRRNDQPAAVYSLGGLLSLRRTQVVQIQNNTGRTVRLVNDTRTRSRVRVPGRRRLAGRTVTRPNTLVRAAGREPAHRILNAPSLAAMRAGAFDAGAIRLCCDAR